MQFSIGLVKYPESNTSPQVLLALTITDQNTQHLLRCINALLVSLNHFVHSSQLHMIQVASETDISKNRDGEMFCLMLMLVHKIL